MITIILIQDCHDESIDNFKKSIMSIINNFHRFKQDVDILIAMDNEKNPSLGTAIFEEIHNLILVNRQINGSDFDLSFYGINLHCNFIKKIDEYAILMQSGSELDPDNLKGFHQLWF